MVAFGRLAQTNVPAGYREDQPSPYGWRQSAWQPPPADSVNPSDVNAIIGVSRSLICVRQERGCIVSRLATFDADYIGRLAQGDPEVGNHFASYFGEIVDRRLSARLMDASVIEDVRQETLLRAMQSVRLGKVDTPARLVALVISISRGPTPPPRPVDRQENPHRILARLVDPAKDIETQVLGDEYRRLIGVILDRLRQRDREMIQAYFLDETGIAEVARRHGISEAHCRFSMDKPLRALRVLWTEALRGRPVRDTWAKSWSSW
jgi:DNA-directed RNA polymerase specialized sigma24 family protein